MSWGASLQVPKLCQGNSSYVFGYAYNVAGGLEVETYPTATRKVKSCYDSVGRISVVSNPTTNTPYATVDATSGYTPFGAIRKLTLGNNLVESTLFDSADGVSENNTRLQPTHKTVVDATNTQLLGLKYGYCVGSLTGCTTNNGNVMSQTISPAAAITFTQTFGYDVLDRLTTANEVDRDTVNLGWGESYGFKWGNKYTSRRTGSLPGLMNLTPSVATAFNTANQVITGSGNVWSYDLDGNVTKAGSGPQMVYDGENRMVSSTPGSGTASNYVYDGLGHRVVAVVPDPQSGTATITTTFVYDAMGNLATEYATASTASIGTSYLTVDVLGSTRLVTNSSGVPQARYDYLPFGEEIWSSSNGRGAIPGYALGSVRQKFTGKERDAATGLDYFGARYYSGAQGRWTSPDLVNLTSDRLLSPSSTINKYVYGGNNPLRFVDPDGRDITVFYEQGLPTGHIMLAASNQQTGDFAFMSVGPQTHLDSGIPLHPFSGVPGTSAFAMPQTVDDLRNNFAAITIQTTPEVAQQAIDAIRNGAGTGNWALLGNNCTTACAKVLREVGLLGVNEFATPFARPTTLWNTLRLRYQPNLSRWSKYSLSQNSGAMNKVMNGTDYGSPRYGVNTFDWLMLQLKAPLKECVSISDSASGTKSTECK